MKSAPIEAMTEEPGKVRITHHTSANMELAVVNELLAAGQTGKTCVLTNTNEEALRILGLLLKHGRKARLIQSLDGFRLYDLLEIRIFLHAIDRSLHSPVISDEIWENAKKTLFHEYHSSACIENIKRLITAFEATHSVKYRTDLEEFLRESKFEDFYDEENREVIYVSTIHKSKGREFDHVFMMLKNAAGRTDEERRVLYVGMTRAKSSLYIHTNTALFDPCHLPGIEHITDAAAYEEPSEIMLQTTHRDVVLDFFKGRQKLISSLRSGTALKIDNVYLTAEHNGREMRVARFSKAFTETLTNLRKKGYVPISSEIRFIIAWKGKDDEKETPILLLNVHLRK